ncbi:STAS domain-containing protein [Streptosporangium sp. NBC_01756]|uniref:STAS domain-containing protein n=1 Tax=Streptosporangium sp. NBC_01756 TaxID=2975950 RepID=UPI002DD98064|nr:STAS domain-containing protein [Streptosporangium sp. NBC_01756]WSC83215.1 STAS domain-containing protein [Streptosporangium sp. NBC_01756]
MSTEGAGALSISSGSHGTAMVIHAVGELDYDYAPMLRRELTQVWSGADPMPPLILDLAGLTFCDSTGLAELLWILRRSQEGSTRLVLTGVSRTLRHMLAMTGLLSRFTVSASVEEALRDG